MATDPICGMAVDPATAQLTLLRDGRTYYFCSSSCLEQFASPSREVERTRRQLLVGWPLALLTVVLAYLWHPVGYLWLEAGTGTVLQVYLGAPFYRGALDALRSRIGNMDLLVAVATSAAWGFSLASLALPSRLPAVSYFDAAALILVLLRTGSLLEQLVRRRASSAVTRLQEILPARALRLVADREESVAVTDLCVGDRVRIFPGERFPTDGVVRNGRSAADQSLLTGEQRPVPKHVGALVIAGSLNLEGLLEVEASATGEDTFLAEVGRLVTDAELAQVPLRQLADRIASWFAPLVLTLALLAAVGWGVFGHAPLGIAVLIFVSVAITACPCAFGIATPAAIVVAVGRAAQEGVLFKGREAIERSAGVDVVLFDKTGTLTAGRPVLVAQIGLPGRRPEELLALASGLESGSSHPLARALRGAAAAQGVSPAAMEDSAAVPGVGVTARRSGMELSLRRLAVEGFGERSAPPWSDAIRDWSGQGHTISILYEGTVAVAAFAFSDELAVGAAECVRELREAGIEVGMITGDSLAAAQRVAAALGIHRVAAECAPAAKLALIRQYQAAGRRVGFAGDGINDAPALAAADVGIAVGAGLDVAKEAGQVVLLRDDLRGIPLALALARGTVRKVRQNLLWALGYNAILLPIAAGLLIPFLGFGVYVALPILGALAMGFSSTLVVANSLSLRRTRLSLETVTEPSSPSRGRLAPVGGG
ncbi:MAG: heavy metal translocating P-type ATPase [Thermoplasmata archaeon]|nr:heavy metal translocating P-type ATPase [Thermoplasmata archaeon]MCI4341280.1 heavy metal translocating P-type ATPase [Thermoplasmata archaeon]